jgi:hypothetical protein
VVEAYLAPLKPWVQSPPPETNKKGTFIDLRAHTECLAKDTKGMISSYTIVKCQNNENKKKVPKAFRENKTGLIQRNTNHNSIGLLNSSI